jgi:hypothetical protein
VDEKEERDERRDVGEYLDRTAFKEEAHGEVEQ